MGRTDEICSFDIVGAMMQILLFSLGGYLRENQGCRA